MWWRLQPYVCLRVVVEEMARGGHRLRLGLGLGLG